LALIFRVFSCLISSLILLFALCFSSFTTPRPRSFHSLLLFSYLYSLHFLQQICRGRTSQHDTAVTQYAEQQTIDSARFKAEMGTPAS
jgi:hypothetical protein